MPPRTGFVPPKSLSKLSKGRFGYQAHAHGLPPARHGNPRCAPGGPLELHGPQGPPWVWMAEPPVVGVPRRPWMTLLVGSRSPRELSPKSSRPIPPKKQQNSNCLRQVLRLVPSRRSCDYFCFFFVIGLQYYYFVYA